MILDKLLSLAISHPISLEIVNWFFNIHDTASVQLFMIWPRIPKCTIPVF